MSEYKKDALRWRYTQQEGYFVCGPYNTDGDFSGYSVGVLKYEYDSKARYSEPAYMRQLSLNKCIEGRGKTLKSAIDRALKKGTIK